MSEQIKNMFSRISQKYDLINDILSLGMHRLWRRKAVKYSGIRKGESILDCACGTGDFAFEFKHQLGESSEILACDFCEDMLVIGSAKANRLNFNIKFEQQDILALTYPDDSFDNSCIAFGIRNVDNTVECLREMARVIRPGGKIIVLEFGQPTGLFEKIYSLYSSYYIPFIGKLVTGDKAAYEYLPRSTAAYYAGFKFIEKMYESSVLENCRFKKMTGGLAYIYIAEVKKCIS
ncbi:MAG: ubiquinone/menaquinone biosynthesis methyltransferase [Candidatus Kapabacteria bacterium]|nr:ubiquinone/menaquinone biosynthesis methyltransferase [Candidatus Kapabacteria bacterium]